MITRISASYVIGYKNGDHAILANGQIVFDDKTIIYVGTGFEGDVDRDIDAGDAIVSPGFVDLDALADIDHALIDTWHDTDTALGLDWSEDYFTNRRREVFTPDEVAFKREYALVQLIKNGITTAMPIAAETHNAWAETYDDMMKTAEIGRRLGLRMYLGPSYRAGVNIVRSDGTRDVMRDEEMGRKGLEDAVRFVEAIRAMNDDLMVGCLLPCRVETLTPELMRQTAKASRDLDCLVRLHCLQGMHEIDYLQRWYGKSPVELLRDTGLLMPNVLVPHGIFIGGHMRNPAPYANEIEILAETGISIIHCPYTSLRDCAILMSFDRYRRAGVNIALGTDSFPPDMIRNMDIGNHLGKAMEGRYDAADAASMFRAATTGGAKALGRDDIGRLAVGSPADMIIVTLGDLRVGAIDDPIRTLQMNCNGGNISTVIINGRFVMENNRIDGLDEADFKARGQRYFEKMKAAYSDRDYLRRDTKTLFPPSFPDFEEIQA